MLSAGGHPTVAFCAWNKTCEGVFEVGRLLIEAKAALPHGEFTAMVEAELPFVPQTARKLVAIAQDERLHAHVRVCPPRDGQLARAGSASAYACGNNRPSSRSRCVFMLRAR